MAALLTAGPVEADQAQTTRRVGDRVAFHIGCHDEDMAIAVTEDTVRLETFNPPRWQAAREAGLCFRMPGPVPALLKEWVAGPFVMPDGTEVSIWRIQDMTNRWEYGLYTNEGGPHEAEPAL